jgi:mRNA interferase HigB
MQVTHMQILSRRALHEFCSVHPESRGAVLAWLRLMKPGEHEDFSALKQLFKGAQYEPPYVVFPVGNRGARIVALFHYSRLRIYVRHVFTRPEYEAWCSRLQRKEIVRECLEVDAYSLGRVCVANAGIALSREALRHHERAALQRDDRFHE